MKKEKQHNFLKLMIILASIGMQMGVNILPIFIVKDESNFGQILLGDLVQMVVIAGIILLWMKVLPQTFPATNAYRFRKPTIYQVMMVLGIFFFSLVGVYRLLYLMRGGDANVAMIPVTYDSKAEFREELMASIHAVLVAPVLEEMGFRIIPASVVQTKKRRIVTLAILAVAFAAFHLRNFWEPLLDAIVSCILLLKTRNSLLSILYHAFNNFMKTVVFSAAYLGIIDVNMAASGAHIVLFSTPVTIIFLVIGVALILPEVIHSRSIRSMNIENL